MKNDSPIRDLVRQAARIKYLYLSHALQQMIRPDRMITTSEVRQVIEHGEIIEDYPEDKRGHICLFLGKGQGERPVHVVCAPRENFLAIITAYVPDPMEWSNDFRMRRQK